MIMLTSKETHSFMEIRHNKKSDATIILPATSVDYTGFDKLILSCLLKLYMKYFILAIISHSYLFIINCNQHFKIYFI